MWPSIPIIAGGAGARALAAELSAMDVRVDASIPGLVAQLRRIASNDDVGTADGAADEDSPE